MSGIHKEFLLPLNYLVNYYAVTVLLQWLVGTECLLYIRTILRVLHELCNLFTAP